MIVDRFDAFLFDLDGVLYVGEVPLPGAVEVVQRLRAHEKTLRFLTNDPRPSRREAVQRLLAMGFEVDEREVITSGWATAAYLHAQEVESAYVVGSDGLRTTLRGAGLTVTDEAHVDAVVVGCDEHVDYRAIQHAATRIRRGARFIATNADATFPTPEGPYPATGAIVAAVAAAADRPPTVVGKPERLMFEMALQDVSPTARAVMIGDRRDVDIVGAHRTNLAGILVADDDAGRVEVRVDHTPEAVIPTLDALFDEAYTLVHRDASLPVARPSVVAPGVAAVLFDAAGRVLLVRRADTGQWSLPMGHVEPGESVTVALRREVREETGLDASALELSAVYSEPETQVFRYPSGTSKHFITCCFRGSTHGAPDIEASDEISDVAFFDPTALPTPFLTIHERWISDAEQDTALVR